MDMKTNKKRLHDIEISVLDLAPVLSGKTPADSFRNSLDLAQHVEQWGFKRYWLAEHHNMEGIASSATSVLIGYIAGGTSTIRVGSGGVMLPNHAPLVVAEQFGTLESLYPGRIDLGLGRAPGTDQMTAMALRRHLKGSDSEFPKNVQELLHYFSSKCNRKSYVRAIPGEGLNVPIWLLGSSTYSAQLAALLGLPFAFASHFAPTHIFDALKIYRDRFQPSENLKEPYALACVNVIAADTDEEAKRLATSLYQFFLGVTRGTSKPLQPPVESMDGMWNEFEKEAVRHQVYYTFVGSKKTVKEELQEFLDKTQVDELMVVSHIYDHSARLRSYEILSEIWNEKTED
ncbi:LLM class flavin-dependent oxidoreductase [Bacillus smithii]|uniref:LLM class flavin-dependent oxidoreductase n=1 Tax=Bacillus smithii TaxID=1479 RepID=UPI003D22356D